MLKERWKERRRVDAKKGADLRCRTAMPNRFACGSSSAVRRSAVVSVHPRGRRGLERRDGPCRAVGAATGAVQTGTTCSRRRIATVQSPPIQYINAANNNTRHFQLEIKRNNKLNYPRGRGEEAYQVAIV